MLFIFLMENTENKVVQKAKKGFVISGLNLFGEDVIKAAIKENSRLNRP